MIAEIYRTIFAPSPQSPTPSPQPLLLCRHRLQVISAQFGPQVRQHLFGEHRHVLLRKIGWQRAELEQTEQIADAELANRFDEPLAHGSGAADESVATLFDLLARFHRAEELR